MGECDGECAAEAAALLGLAEGGNDGIFDGGEQLESGFTTACATAMAGAVEGDASGFIKFPRPFLDAEAVENEVHNLPSAACERVDASFGVFLELEEVAVEIHRCARSGWHDDGEFSGEDLGAVAGDFARGDPVTGVEGGLAAASLVVGKLHGDAQMFEDFDSGACDIVIEGIAKAGAHEEHALVGGALSGGGHGGLG